MPYVLQERRPALDKVVEGLVNADIYKEPGDRYMTHFLAKLAYENTHGRFILDPGVEGVLELARRAQVKPNGDINYILFKFCKYHVKPSYNNYKAFMGDIYDAAEITHGEYKNEYRESAEWIRIKILTPYEEKAIEKNGDV